MTTPTPQAARSFVNSIVGRYDSLCNPETNIADIFNPPTVEGQSKEDIRRSFLLNFFPDADSYEKPLNEEAVALYYANHNISQLFAESGMLEVSSPSFQLASIIKGFQLEGSIGIYKALAPARIIKALAQAHLRKVDYGLDPLDEFWHFKAIRSARLMGEPQPSPDFTEGRRHFYSQIFQEAYVKSSVEGKREIIGQLAPFNSKLESFPFRYQRVIFKMERTFSEVIKNPYLKTGVCLAISIVSYLTINKIISLSGQFFKSVIFTQYSSVLLTCLPVIIIQISSKVYHRVIGIVAYVVSTRLYGYMFSSNRIIPFVVCLIIPGMAWVYSPARQAAREIGMFLYERLFGPDVRAQNAISKSLENETEANELLEGGMKAYQVWMYLVEQGSQKGIFQEPVSN